MMFRMKFHRSSRRDVLKEIEDSLAQIPELIGSALPTRRSTTKKVVAIAAWVGAGAGVLALGLAAGRELRIRYKLKRRSPYDYYSHSSDPSDLEFGVGI
jgi:hypothetical protein